MGGATTAGALVGLRLRHAAASAPFEAAGLALLESWRLLAPSPQVAIVVGVGAHVVWMLLWGVCFSVASTRLRGLPLAAGAALFVIFLGALSATVVPGALGAAAQAALTTAQTIFFLALLAVSLIAGVIFARKAL